MKIYITFLSLCLFTCASFAQTPQLKKATSPEQIKQLLETAISQHKEVVIYVKQGALNSESDVQKKTAKKRLRVSGWACRFEANKVVIGSNSSFEYFFQFKDYWSVDLSDIESVRFQNKFETFGRRAEVIAGAAYFIATIPVGVAIIYAK